ncbi:cellulose biosynthesis protein BcsN [Methylosinus sp. H3A]|uniref:cellulose biosynthesis protein BcsN n=1 Tax=Methylosinus sp. H3A TaxID=2785786 RepID=UPI0018C2604E|nr:cellulose biosynthesis protein BcsN [Methylosinus sp. H3A]MBG0809321.1 cellulose biosynthesis protein BcsN [Methylosinus sp. H3A]
MRHFSRHSPPLLILALGLSACSTMPTRGVLAVDPTPTGATAGPPPAQGVEARSGAASILALPAEARVRGGLEERRYANGWRQSVALDRAIMGKGWNELTIDIRAQPAGGGREGEIPMGKPTEEGVRQELALRFPTTRMRIVAKPLRNELGPFGLAVGPSPDGARCAFAWQWVDDLRAVARPEAAATTIVRGDEIPASIRLRLCRKGVTEQQFADWFSRLRATETANVERVIEVARSGADAPPLAPSASERPAAPATVASIAAPAKRAIAHKVKAWPVHRHEETTTEARRYSEPAKTVETRAASVRFDPALPPQAFAGPPRSAAR